MTDPHLPEKLATAARFQIDALIAQAGIDDATARRVVIAISKNLIANVVMGF